ncbi:MAG: hypothetical protein KDA85_08910, partial [Planctomycetaceae bacterium]|nr:hypothetical protein [Planctomycetaceae bacterium]
VLTGVIFVASGSAEIGLPGVEERRPLERTDSMRWTVSGEQPISEIQFRSGSELDALPGWIYAIDASPIPELQAVMERISTEVGLHEHIVDAVAPLIADRNSAVGVAATELLVISQQGDLLLNQLMSADAESIRRAAIEGLTGLCHESTAGRDRIARSLETRMPSDELQLTMRLIEGISEAEARDPATVAMIVKLLDHERLGMRELAIYRLEQFTKDAFGYHASADTTRRHEAVRRWNRLIDRNEGKLLP